MRQPDANKTFRQSQAATVAKTIWDSAEPAKASHAYLRKRGIRPHDTRVIKDYLIVPVTDRGMIISLQYIHTNGTKRFMPNGRTRGGYYAIGRHREADTLCLAESFSVGASIHEATGYPVFISFYAENLKHVVRTVKEIYPLKTSVICPDNDCLMEKGADATKMRKPFRGGLIHAEQMAMARRISKLKSLKAKRRQAHQLCQSLITMLRCQVAI